MKILIVDDQHTWLHFHENNVKKLFENPTIVTSDSAEDGYNKIIENIGSPFDIIITDLQMETAYEPLLAGEWLVERIKETRAYYKTKIVIISGSSEIKQIAEHFNVDYIRKQTAADFPESYDILKTI